MAFLLLAGSCQDRKTPLQRLQDQLANDSVTLSKLQDRHVHMWDDFRWCDSMLQYVPQEQVDDYFEDLNLAQAYLNQFDEILPLMLHTVSYTRRQLTNLQNDIDTHYISDSLAAVYLEDETAVADTLHHRVLYFQDRLTRQDETLGSIRKSIRKAAKP